MQQKVQAIVLDAFKYKETSVIARVFTIENGMISILISGIGRKKSSITQIFFQPLSKIEFSFFFKEKTSLFRTNNVSLITSPIDVLPDIRKIAIAVFISEVVLRTCKEGESDERLFKLLEKVLQVFKKSFYYDIHLFFLSSYLEILGFSLKGISSEEIERYVYDEKVLQNINYLSELSEYHLLSINQSERTYLLKFYIQYLEKSLDMPKIKSLSILEEVFA